MIDAAGLANMMAGRRLASATDAYLGGLSRAPVLASRSRAARLLRELKGAPGPKVVVGDTAWGEPVEVPLSEFTETCGLCTGGMGSGKSFFATLILEALIERLSETRKMGAGVLDAKGELFDRALFLLGRRMAQLDDRAREALRRRIVIIDFSAREVLSEYNILSRPDFAEADFFIQSRLETLRELLPAGEKVSLRGGTVLRHAVELLSEFSLPLPYIGSILADDALRLRLLSRSRNPELRQYFEVRLREEGKQTIAALRARMETIFAADGVRLALSGASAPDFRALQNEGAIVLVNFAGPTITRGVRLLLQGLVLGDIKQAVFARPNDPAVSFLWVADEAQNYFLTRQQQDYMADLLTMSRSFGSFFHFICQNIGASVPDARVLELLHTNIRWSLTMRGSPRDAQFLRAALPVTGRMPRPESSPFRERAYYSPEEERAILFDGIANLRDREAYLWFKARAGEALRITTRMPEIPRGEAFREAVAKLREDPSLGRRTARAEFERRARERAADWTSPAPAAAPAASRSFENAYAAEREAWRA